MYPRLKRTFSLAITLLASAAVLGTALSARADHFRAFSFTGVSDGHPDYYVLDSGLGSTYFDSPTPDNISLYGFQKTYSGPGGDVTFSAASAANFRGYWSTGTYAYGQVQNAYYPTSSDYGTSPPFGYYVIGGGGSWTKMTFSTPESLTGPYADFHWHVDGMTDANLGTANARLDFAVTQGATSFDDLYNSTVTPNIMTKFGPGTYSYHTAVALDTPLDFLFWSSSFWQVTPGDLAALGLAHEDIHGFAQFFNTYNLDTIDLYNGDGSLVTDWSLTNENGQVVFNQNGRVAPSVPEPGTLALFGTGLLASAGLLRRRRNTR